MQFEEGEYIMGLGSVTTRLRPPVPQLVALPGGKSAPTVSKLSAPAAPYQDALVHAGDLAKKGWFYQDFAIGAFVKALKLGTTSQDALSVAQGTYFRGFAYRDVTCAALDHTLQRLTTHAEAMDAARGIAGLGRFYDDWTLGALKAALQRSTTPAQAQEVASLAQQYGDSMRFTELRYDALAQVEILSL